jgi:hypothetical protein
MAAAVGVRPFQGVGAGGRDTCEPGDDVPGNRPHQGAEDHRVVHDFGRDNARSHRIGDMQAEHREGDEIEKGRPEHGIARRQNPGRNHGGDGIGGVVQTVEEIEDQGDAHQHVKDRQHIRHGAFPKFRYALLRCR